MVRNFELARMERAIEQASALLGTAVEGTPRAELLHDCQRALEEKLRCEERRPRADDWERFLTGAWVRAQREYGDGDRPKRDPGDGPRRLLHLLLFEHDLLHLRGVLEDSGLVGQGQHSAEDWLELGANLVHLAQLYAPLAGAWEVPPLGTPHQLSMLSANAQRRLEAELIRGPHPELAMERLTEQLNPALGPVELERRMLTFRRQVERLYRSPGANHPCGTVGGEELREALRERAARLERFRLYFRQARQLWRMELAPG
jgi:hypothetical protein